LFAPGQAAIGLAIVAALAMVLGVLLTMRSNRMDSSAAK